MPTNMLYRNKGDGTFTDVTEQVGLAGSGFGIGCAVGGHGASGRSATGLIADAPEAAGIVTVVATAVAPGPLSSLRAASRSIPPRLNSAGVPGLCGGLSLRQRGRRWHSFGENPCNRTFGGLTSGSTDLDNSAFVKVGKTLAAQPLARCLPWQDQLIYELMIDPFTECRVRRR
ncbi:MAG TPA: hypothetical protein VG013_14655 [Gemmataceae bacterium]|nr:hypothetical protein [Gemmataceae bacterium]